MARRREVAWDDEAHNPQNGDTEAERQTAETHLSSTGEEAGEIRDDSGLTAAERRKLTPEQKRERFIQVFGYDREDENSSQRFTRIGAGRVSRIIDGLRSIPSLGNRSSYAFTQEQAERMFTRLEDELRDARAQFTRNAVEGISRSKSFSFT